MNSIEMKYINLLIDNLRRKHRLLSQIEKIDKDIIMYGEILKQQPLETKLVPAIKGPDGLYHPVPLDYNP
jgi:hypothetical protein